MHMNRIDRLAVEVFNLLRQQTSPISRDDIIALTDVNSVVEFHNVKTRLQAVLSSTDTVTLVGQPGAGQEAWYYSLVGTATDEYHDYMVLREEGIYARTTSSWHVVTPLVRAADPTTAEGLRLSRQQRSLERTLDDTYDVLVDLGVSPPPPPHR